jgi:hypothetical protein
MKILHNNLEGAFAKPSAKSWIEIMRMEKNLKRCLAASAFALGLMTLSGCGKQTTEVRGTVKVNGETVNSGNIAFIAEDGRTDSAVIADGSYAILKAPIGKVKITIKSTKPVANANPHAGRMAGAPPEVQAQASGASSSPKKFVEVPKKYGDENTTDLTYDVKSGKQEYDIDLPRN